jgi:hypothetical protein
MPNAWVTHVKQYAAANNTSYGCAMTIPGCKTAYKSKKESKESKETKEIKDTKVYTMYKKPIGPVIPATPPVTPAPKKAVDKSTIKKMLEQSMNEMKDYKDPKIKLPKSKK